jgi:hypothetical protein
VPWHRKVAYGQKREVRGGVINQKTLVLLPTLVSTYWLRFEVFTAVTMKNVVFWDVKPCGSCKNRRFGGT